MHFYPINNYASGLNRHRKINPRRFNAHIAPSTPNQKSLNRSEPKQLDPHERIARVPFKTGTAERYYVDFKKKFPTKRQRLFARRVQ